MTKKKIDEIPEHLERMLIRPLVENFSYTYMHKNSYDNFVLKVVEYDPNLKAGIAHVYFSTTIGEYIHLQLRIPIKKKMENGKSHVTLEDPVVVKTDNESPRKKISKK